MDTSWIELPRTHPQYISGCMKFLEFAKQNTDEGKILCPCKNCKVEKWKPMREKLSEVGKAARASVDHVHTTGSTSFADRRFDLEEKLKREPSELEVFVDTHTQKKGGFVENTTTDHFVDIAKSKVKEKISSESSDSRVVIENQVFEELMFQGVVPKRPINYRYGVKQSDVYGVHGIIRKEAKTNNNVRFAGENAELEKLKRQIEESNAKQKETNELTNELIKMLATQMIAVHSGSTPSHLLEGAKSALRVLSSQESMQYDQLQDSVAQRKSGSEHLQQKQKELQAKEAELRRREEALKRKEADAKGGMCSETSSGVLSPMSVFSMRKKIFSL